MAKVYISMQCFELAKRGARDHRGQTFGEGYQNDRTPDRPKDRARYFWS